MKSLPLSNCRRPSLYFFKRSFGFILLIRYSLTLYVWRETPPPSGIWTTQGKVGEIHQVERTLQFDGASTAAILGGEEQQISLKTRFLAREIVSAKFRPITCFHLLSTGQAATEYQGARSVRTDTWGKSNYPFRSRNLFANSNRS